MVDVFILEPHSRLKQWAKQRHVAHVIDPFRSGEGCDEANVWIQRVEQALRPKSRPDDTFLALWHLDPKVQEDRNQIQIILDLHKDGRFPSWWRGVVLYRGYPLQPEEMPTELKQAVFHGCAEVMPFAVEENPSVHRFLERFVNLVRSGDEAEAVEMLRRPLPPENLLSVYFVLTAAERTGDARWLKVLSPPIWQFAGQEYLRAAGKVKPAERRGWPRERDVSALEPIRSLLRQMTADRIMYDEELSPLGCPAHQTWRRWKHDEIGQRLRKSEVVLRDYWRLKGWDWLTREAVDLPEALGRAAKSFIEDFSPAQLVHRLSPLEKVAPERRNELATVFDDAYQKDGTVQAFAARLEPAVESFVATFNVFLEKWGGARTEANLPQMLGTYAALQPVRDHLYDVLESLPPGIILP